MMATSPANSFGSAEEYVAFMREPSRIVRLEWRKVRRQEGKGLTSHSWLEAHCLDSKRLRLEIYSDLGFNVIPYDPITDAKPPNRFFDPDSTLYDGHRAEAHEFSCSLTAGGLTDIAKKVATSKPYSLTEFNCHHFVLEVWNSVVIYKLKASHYPDRAKTGLLWGLEGTLGAWLEGFGSKSESLGAPVQKEDPPLFKSGYMETSPKLSQRNGHTLGLRDVGDPMCGEVEFSARQAPDFDRRGRLASFDRMLAKGCVHLLEPFGHLIPTGLPPRSLCTDGMDLAEARCQAWAKLHFQGLEDAAERLAERIESGDVEALVERLMKEKQDFATARNRHPPCDPLRMSSLSSVSSVQKPPKEADVFVRAPQIDVGFVALRSKELRLAMYIVVQPVDAPPCYMRVLTGDALAMDEACWTYYFWEVEREVGAVMKPIELAVDELQSLQGGLRYGNWDCMTAM